MEQLTNNFEELKNMRREAVKRSVRHEVELALKNFKEQYVSDDIYFRYKYRPGVMEYKFPTSHSNYSRYQDCYFTERCLYLEEDYIDICKEIQEEWGSQGWTVDWFHSPRHGRIFLLVGEYRPVVSRKASIKGGLSYAAFMIKDLFGYIPDEPAETPQKSKVDKFKIVDVAEFCKFKINIVQAAEISKVREKYKKDVDQAVTSLKYADLQSYSQLRVAIDIEKKEYELVKKSISDIRQVIWYRGFTCQAYLMCGEFPTLLMRPKNKFDVFINLIQNVFGYGVV